MGEAGEAVCIELIGHDMGAVIGRRGETLDAIQQLTNCVVNRGKEKRVRIYVDTENYRKKQEESLVRLAHKTAEKVVRHRRNVRLDPMNAYERHVIHTSLQNTPDVSSYSTGNEPNRCVLVAYDRKKQVDPPVNSVNNDEKAPAEVSAHREWA